MHAIYTLLRSTFLAVGPTVALCVALAGCGRKDPESSPDGAVKALIELLGDSAKDPHAFPEAGHDAYRYLATSTKKKLEVRAERASKLQGRRVSPEDMLAPGLFGLRFQPRIYSTTLKNDHADVEVRGDTKDEYALVHCVREQNPVKETAFVWRVELEVPDAPAQPKQDRLP